MIRAYIAWGRDAEPEPRRDTWLDIVTGAAFMLILVAWSRA